jgi:rare lipoprotein A
LFPLPFYRGVRIILVNQILKKVFLILLPLISFACSSAPRFSSDKEKLYERSYTDNEDLSRYEKFPVLESVEGIASYYADKYHGKITYNGEVYDMNGISAAHQTYPMETIIRVTNLSNNKNVILRINDRMPYWKDRIIDLSLGTAKALDFIEKGLTKVRIDVLKWGEGKK